MTLDGSFFKSLAAQLDVLMRAYYMKNSKLFLKYAAVKNNLKQIKMEAIWFVPSPELDSSLDMEWRQGRLTKT